MSVMSTKEQPSANDHRQIRWVKYGHEIIESPGKDKLLKYILN